MGNFSIKDLEHLSGIKAHTLRIWEQRYQLIEPKRTQTNIRFYDDKDLKLVLNVALLKDNGIKISKIAEMDESELQTEVLRLTQTNFNYPEQIHALTISMVDLDEDRFEKIMSSNILKLGFENTMINVIYPFLTKIGILWQTGAINPAQEHFITNLIRQKLIVSIDNQYVALSPSAKKYVLYLPEGEVHELSLLFADFIIKSRQNRSIYLGQSLPLHDLEAVYKKHKPDFIISVITSTPGSSEIQRYIDTIADRFTESTILLSGYQVVGQDLKLKSNVIIFNRIKDLIDFVEEASMVYV
jgi:DNA-binding transcriptional MerR regulator